MRATPPPFYITFVAEPDRAVLYLSGELDSPTKTEPDELEPPR